MQVINQMLGGKVQRSDNREFGRAELFIDNNKDLFVNLPSNLTCWMSHSDGIKSLPKGFVKIAHTLNASIASFANRSKKIYGVQFHPEVIHTQRGTQVLTNFIFHICGCLPRWTMDKFIKTTVDQIKDKVGKEKSLIEHMVKESEEQVEKIQQLQSTIIKKIEDKEKKLKGSKKASKKLKSSWSGAVK